jgi:hypothetical protein
MVDDKDTGGAAPGGGRLGRRILALVGSLVLAGLTAFIVNLASKGADKVVPPTAATAGTKGATRSPISYSSVPVSTECAGSTFLPEPFAKQVIGEASRGEDWSAIEHEPGAAPAGRGIVEASIQGESNRVITLTGITFKVHRMARPSGVAVVRPCGGPMEGRAIEVDLDSSPPRVVASKSEKSGIMGAEQDGKQLSRPITFPWTVSLTDPLQLYIFASTKHCYCSWRAEITWASGAHRGVIAITNRGKDYLVAGGAGLRSYTWAGTELGWVH